MSVADSLNAASYFVPKEVCLDFERSSRLEWLETNHTGGFAMGTVAGVNTRRYHGLLIASLHPPADRFSLLARVEETVTCAEQTFAISCAQFPGVVQPLGNKLLENFRINPFPTWQYDLGGVKLEKLVCLIDGQQATLVCYRPSQDCRLQVNLMLSFRDYHALTSSNSAISGAAQVTNGRCSFTPYPGLPAITFLHNARPFVPEPFWCHNNEYLRELERGLDFREDLYSPGYLSFDLKANTRGWFLASIEKADFERQLDAGEVEALLMREAKRRAFRKPSARAFDQFRVTREDGKPTLIAGYPWFTDWSRDTLISLPALNHSGFPLTETKAILSTLLDARSNGMLPNRFSDRSGTAEYNTVDGTLWLFVAAYDYLRQTGDADFLRQTLYPAARDILDWHHRGTAYGIKSDPRDGLLFAGVAGTQLTWMDAKIGDFVATPRIGKPVEINALWYNALKVCERWARLLGLAEEAEGHAAEAKTILMSFQQKFWNSQAGCLYDVLTDSGNDASIRPNQLFAISLPFPLLDGERARSVVNVVKDKLLTPRGLRTLAPDDVAYRPRFEGDMSARDHAYHQGTVWPWLIGPFVIAYSAAFGHDAASRSYCDGALRSVENEMEACCLGSISEVYDGSEPQRPGGCPAQLWSVAQVLLARAFLDSGGLPASAIQHLTPGQD